jgi:hypothetical protein
MQDGTELMAYLYYRGHFTQAEESPLPGLIILNLKISPHSGIELLSEIKKHHQGAEWKAWAQPRNAI